MPNSYVTESMKDTFKDHTLVLNADTDHVKAWYLKSPEHGRLMSCLIVFTDEGIAIMGDLVPTQNGVISSYGYGVQWFTGHLSEDYLCEKFLAKEFVPELAEQSFKESLLYARRQGDLDKEESREAWDKIESLHDELGPDRFYALYWDTFDDSPDTCGYDYNPGDAGWLCAIQQKFSELYSKGNR
jgi:hypothetical protein